MGQIQWYPGHMTKAKRNIQADLAKVDAVIELLDARIPVSSRNPDLDNILRGMPRVIVLNKADLAQPEATKQWQKYFQGKGQVAVPYIATRSGANAGIVKAMQEATRSVAEKWKAKGVNKTIRLMVVGIPNCGKSTFINCLAGGARAKTSDRPGVTRGNQWVKLPGGMELLDTPGMLWPKFEDARVARNLAIVGSINDEILDREELAEILLDELMASGSAESAQQRFGLPVEKGDEYCWLEHAGRSRGWLMKGGIVDIHRAARLVLDEFRAGRLGPVTLELPSEE